MKKKLLTLAMALVMTLAFVGCSGHTAQDFPNDGTQEPEQSNSPTITDMTSGDVEVYEVIVPWSFQEGDPVDNPYYKKGTDEDGNPVYMVEKSNGQVSYLPMGETVVYASENEVAHFERTTYTYKEDGEEKSFVQYQLYVNTLSPEGDGAADKNLVSDLLQRGDDYMESSKLPADLDEMPAVAELDEGLQLEISM